MSVDNPNPLVRWLSMPEAAVISHQDIIPTPDQGWGLELRLALPRWMARAHVTAQLTTAGFVEETAGVSDALFRFLRDDAYVWGQVSDENGGCRVLLMTSSAPEDPEQY